MTSSTKNKPKTKQNYNKTNTNTKTNYCCLDKVKKKCTKIKSTLTLIKKSKTHKAHKAHKAHNTHNTPNYAITTLIFGGDSYLPGVLLLGSSIRKVLPKTYAKYITLCCMVTNNVSSEAKKLIATIYDRIIPVDYLQIPPDLIKHTIPKTRHIYSKTFTKLRIFDMIEYDKVLFMDADMLVLKKDIISLFNLNTPATVFMGKVGNTSQDRYFKEFKENGKLFRQFQNKYCQWQNTQLHGNLIPYDKYENEQISNGMNIETSVLLIQPSKYMMNVITKRLQTIRQKHIKISGDTEMISRLFKDKLYAIEPRFFGRWVNPEDHPELVVLDLYGNAKPWDPAHFKDFIKYLDVGDVIYWWKMYKSIYETDYIKYKNKILDNLYNSIQ